MKTKQAKLESFTKFQKENKEQSILNKSQMLNVAGGQTVPCNDADGCLHSDSITIGTAISNDLVIGPYSN